MVTMKKELSKFIFVFPLVFCNFANQNIIFIGLEDNDIHYLLSFVIHMNEAKIPFQFDVLEKKISSLEPDDFLCQVKYCSLMYIISTFAHGQLRYGKFYLIVYSYNDTIYCNYSFPFLKNIYYIGM